MRYLRLFAVLFLVFSILFSIWVNNRYFSSLNADSPEIQNSTDLLQISVQDPPEAILRGLTATDATDGDLTNQIMVSSISHFLKPGTVNVRYVVFDKHNNSATLTRKVHYTDYTSPVFSLEKAPIYTVGNSFDLLDYVKVTDCIDGDISGKIRVISNMVNNYSVGQYPVVLEVSNSCGDTAQITLWVSYQNKAPTAFIHLYQYIIYITEGDEFDPYRWVTSVTDRDANPLSTKKIEILGNLDINTPGSYQLVYSYNDGKLTGQSALTVVVAERQE